ncbi:MAG: WD40/YVTN/BNR-like repeat-containing protein [Acidimicrobiales bacterium]
MLIREARRRQRRRRLSMALVATLLATVGLVAGLIHAGGPPGTPVAPSRPAGPPSRVLAPGTPVPVRDLSLVSFVDPAHGLAVVGSLLLPTSLHQLAVSSDGGRHWRSVGAALPATPFAYPRQSFTFTTRSTGYLLSVDGVWRTVDGGLRWSAVLPASPTPPYWAPSSSGPSSSGMVRPAYLAAVGSSIWVLGARTCQPADATQPTCQMGILASDDRGTTWTALPLPSAFAGLFAVARSGTRDAALVVGTTTGNTGPTRLVTTADGGRTWSSAGGPPCTGLTPDSLAFVGHGLVALCEGGTIRTWQRQLWATTDGGRTWVLWGSRTGVEGSTAAAGSDEIVADRGTLWLATSKGALLRSDDGGRRWTSILVAKGATAGVQLLFAGARHGWYVAYGVGLWRTSGGGAHWRAVTGTR